MPLNPPMSPEQEAAWLARRAGFSESVLDWPMVVPKFQRLIELARAPLVAELAEFADLKAMLAARAKE